MKRRYTILFFIALSPLFGLSLLASKLGSSMWSMFNIHLFSSIVAAAIAAYAGKRSVEAKWPAVVALIASLPMTYQMATLLDVVAELAHFIGVSIVLILPGSIATTVASLVIVMRPLPPPPREPQVAPARVVD